jgi:hypothetical protein
MIDLAQRSESYDIGLPYGLKVTVKPLTTAGMAAAQAAARRAVEAIERQVRERTGAGLQLHRLPDLSAEGERDGFYQAQLIRELAVRHIMSWTGVEREGGPAPPTPENIAAVMELYPVGERFFQEFTLRVWTPPVLQLGSLIIRHDQVSCWNVSGLCCGPVAAGLDEIRGRLPIMRTSSRLCVFFGFGRPRSDRSCHRQRTLRSSWKVALRSQSDGHVRAWNALVDQAGARYSSSRRSIAQMMRASLLATAATTTLKGRRATRPSIHVQKRPLRPAARRTSDRAPCISWRRR